MKISLLSNGKEGDEWRDLNCEFRQQVANALLSEFHALNKDLTQNQSFENLQLKGPLIKDLFRAEAAYCRETWGATSLVSELGVLLLKTTHERFIEDYFLGKEESFDTQSAISLGDVPRELIQLIIQQIKISGLQCNQGEFDMSDVLQFLQEFLDSRTD